MALGFIKEYRKLLRGTGFTVGPSSLGKPEDAYAFIVYSECESILGHIWSVSKVGRSKNYHQDNLTALDTARRSGF